MKKSFLLGGFLLGIGTLGSTIADAQFNYTSGDVVVYRVGDGTATLTSAGTTVFLDEYNPVTGALDGSYNLTTAGGLPLVSSGTASSEGLLTLSGNGQYLLATGYDAPVATTSVASTTSAADPREVATISSTGAVVQTTINNYSGNNIRSATSQDGTSIYTSGATTGILNVTSGATNTVGTVISSTVTSTRDLNIVGGNLYLSNSTGTTYRVAQVGTGLPTTGGQTLTETLPLANITGPYQFAGAMLAATSTTADTFYVADNTAGTLEKFSLVSGNFTLTGTATLTGISGLAIRPTANGELIVATTGTGIYTLTDASGQGGTLTATFGTALVTVPTNEAFRGDAFAPTAVTVVPEPSTYGLLLAGGLGVWAATRRRSRKLAA